MTASLDPSRWKYDQESKKATFYPTRGGFEEEGEEEEDEEEGCSNEEENEEEEERRMMREAEKNEAIQVARRPGLLKYSVYINNQDGAQLNKLSLKIQFKMLNCSKYDKIN